MQSQELTQMQETNLELASEYKHANESPNRWPRNQLTFPRHRANSVTIS